MLCPAAGTHPTVACPVKRRSLGRTPPRLPLIDVTPTPAGPPAVCRRESLTFTRDIGIRHWQELDHGLAPGSTTTSACATVWSTSTATPRTTKPSNAAAPAASAESPPSPSSSPSRSPMPTTANSAPGSTPSNQRPPRPAPPLQPPQTQKPPRLDPRRLPPRHHTRELIHPSPHTPPEQHKHIWPSANPQRARSRPPQQQSRSKRQSVALTGSIWSVDPGVRGGT